MMQDIQCSCCGISYFSEFWYVYCFEGNGDVIEGRHCCFTVFNFDAVWILSFWCITKIYNMFLICAIQNRVYILFFCCCNMLNIFFGNLIIFLRPEYFWETMKIIAIGGNVATAFEWFEWSNVPFRAINSNKNGSLLQRDMMIPEKEVWIGLEDPVPCSCYFIVIPVSGRKHRLDVFHKELAFMMWWGLAVFVAKS